jgi:hypothetical protein
LITLNPLVSLLVWWFFGLLIHQLAFSAEALFQMPKAPMTAAAAAASTQRPGQNGDRWVACITT